VKEDWKFNSTHTTSTAGPAFIVPGTSKGYAQFAVTDDKLLLPLFQYSCNQT